MTNAIVRREAPKRYTLGVVYEPDTVDSHGDFTDAATIERACHDFNTRLQGRDPLAKMTRMAMEAITRDGADAARLVLPEVAIGPAGPTGLVLKGMLGIQHGAWDDGFGLIVESYIAPTDLTIGGQPVKKGSWLMGVIWSPTIWEKIIAGEITGYSLGGMAKRVPDVQVGKAEQARIIKAGAGVMVALYLPASLADALAVDGGERPADMHLTLAYLGKTDDMNLIALDLCKQDLALLCAGQEPIKGSIGGYGRFTASETSDGKDVVYASFDAPGLPEFRQRVVACCEAAGLPVAKQHGFTPHITLAYIDPAEPTPFHRVKRADVTFNELAVVVGPAREAVPIGTQARLIEYDPASPLA